MRRSSTTGFYTDERTFWHSGVAITALTLPVGGWVQPPSGTVGVDTPDTKRRLLNLARVSGLFDHSQRPPSEPVTRDELLRVHTAGYLDRFKAASDAVGGELGPAAAFGPGGFEIAQVSAGLARSAVTDVVAGKVRYAYALCRRAGTIACRTRRWAPACSPTRPSLSRPPGPTTASAPSR